MREAIERGQLPFDEHRRKRRRMDDGNGERPGNFRGRGGGQRGRGRGRGRGRAVDGGWEGRKLPERPVSVATPVPGLPKPMQDVSEAISGSVPNEDSSGLNPSDSDSDSDAPPEAISSKGPPATTLESDVVAARESEDSEDDDAVGVAGAPAHSAPQPQKKPRPKQPRRPLHNPFAQRTSLLRNVGRSRNSLTLCRDSSPFVG